MFGYDVIPHARGYVYLWGRERFRGWEVEPCVTPHKVFQSGTRRIIELPEIVCKVFLDISAYIFLRRKAGLGRVPLKQSLKQGFECTKELSLGKRTKESRMEHRRDPREDVVGLAGRSGALTAPQPWSWFCLPASVRAGGAGCQNSWVGWHSGEGVL